MNSGAQSLHVLSQQEIPPESLYQLSPSITAPEEEQMGEGLTPQSTNSQIQTE